MINKDLYMRGFHKQVAQNFCPECKAPMFMQTKGICGYCDRFKEDPRYLAQQAKINELKEENKMLWFMLQRACENAISDHIPDGYDFKAEAIKTYFELMAEESGE